MQKQNNTVYRVLTLVETNEDPNTIQTKIQDALGHEAVVRVTDGYGSWKYGLMDLIEQKGW